MLRKQCHRKWNQELSLTLQVTQDLVLFLKTGYLEVKKHSKTATPNTSGQTTHSKPHPPTASNNEKEAA